MSPRVRYTAFFKFSLKQEKYHRRINYILLGQARQHCLPDPRQAMLHMGHIRLKERRCVFSSQEKGAASPTQLSLFPGARQNGFYFLKGQNAIFSCSEGNESFFRLLPVFPFFRHFLGKSIRPAVFCIQSFPVIRKIL